MIHDGPTFERWWLERLARKQRNQPKEQPMKKSKGKGGGKKCIEAMPIKKTDKTNPPGH